MGSSLRNSNGDCSDGLCHGGSDGVMPRAITVVCKQLALGVVYIDTDLTRFVRAGSEDDGRSNRNLDVCVILEGVDESSCCHNEQ